jgi:hypothetical protein
MLRGSCAGDAAYMSRKALTFGIVLLALVPATRLAWLARDMPHLGHFHDDSIYLVSAKSLAEGHGYRILSLPAEPFQTKYPPLWPLILAAIWKIAPHFPENLKWEMALTWLMLPLFVGLAWRWFRAAGLSFQTRVALCAVLALNPWMAFLSTTVMSDLVFSALLLAVLLATRQASRNAWAAPAAGILAAAAYLVKAAALPFLIAGPLWLALRRKFRAAAILFCAMLPAVVWWMLWARQHRSHARDIVSLYYTDYLGYQIYNVGWRDLPLVMWKNLDAIFSSVGGLLIFDLGNTPAGMHFARLLAIGAIIGTVRFARQRGMTPYHWFAAGYTAILLVWHFQPNERFLLPLYPLLLAGIATELQHLTGVIRKAWPRGMANRVVGVAMAGSLAALTCGGTAWNLDALLRHFPGIIEQHRAVLASNRIAFSWIAQHAPDAAFWAYDDPVFFLYTGQHAAHQPVDPLPFYRQDREAILRPFRSLPAFARQQHLDYLFLTAADFHRDLPPAERAEVGRILAQDAALRLAYQSPLGSIFRVARASLPTERVEISTAAGAQPASRSPQVSRIQ